MKAASVTKSLNTKPRHDTPQSEKVKSVQEKDLTDNELSDLMVSTTKIKRSVLPKLFSEAARPIDTESKTNKQKSAFTLPKTSAGLPTCVNDCENDARSMCKESKANKTNPKHIQLRSSMAKPKCAASTTGKAKRKPTRAEPNVKGADPSWLKERRDKMDSRLTSSRTSEAKSN